MSKKIGLVLSGGGVKGAYEIGVYQALTELGIVSAIDGIAGTSVGALNAVLLSCCDLETALEIWENLKITDLLRFSPEAAKHATLVDFLKNGLPFNQEGIAALIDEKIPFDKIRHTIYVACTEVFRSELVIFHLNSWNPENQKKIILASSALPLIYTGFQGVEIAGYHYVDGGVAEHGNTPIAPLYERGWTHIVAVHLKPRASNATALPKKYPYADQADLIEIYPSQDLGSTLFFTKEHLKRNLQLGYADTMELADQLLELHEKVKWEA